MNRRIGLFVFILVFGSAWLWWSSPDEGAANTGAAADAANTGAPTGVVNAENDPAVGPGVGRIAPDFRLPTLDGSSFRLSDLRGKPVVLNFWATWCGPCQRELPALQKAAVHFEDEVIIVGVDQGEEAETVQRYVDELGLTFPIPLDADGDVGFVYNVKGLPTTFFIDRNGVIQSLWMGEMNSVTLAEQIAGIQ
jgi:peroxiredoxin